MNFIAHYFGDINSNGEKNAFLKKKKKKNAFLDKVEKCCIISWEEKKNYKLYYMCMLKALLSRKQFNTI